MELLGGERRVIGKELSLRTREIDTPAPFYLVAIYKRLVKTPSLHRQTRPGVFAAITCNRSIRHRDGRKKGGTFLWISSSPHKKNSFSHNTTTTYQPLKQENCPTFRNIYSHKPLFGSPYPPMIWFWKNHCCKSSSSTSLPCGFSVSRYVRDL